MIWAQSKRESFVDIMFSSGEMEEFCMCISGLPQYQTYQDRSQSFHIDMVSKMVWKSIAFFKNCKLKTWIPWMLKVICSHTFRGRVYTRGLQPWPIEPHLTHLLDETMGKPLGHGSRAFVHSVNPIWTKRMDHVHLFNEILFLLKKNGNVVALI